MLEGRIYCGPAPEPTALLARWNLDPWLLSAMAVLFALLWWRADDDAARRGAAVGALATALVAFVSPLCALSSALFSARIAHHLLLVGLAAPLIAWALPRRAPVGLPLATLAQAAAIWLWHAPEPYEAALSHPAIYWAMELSLLGTAVLFWMALRARRDEWLGPLSALAASMGQMGLLGAVLTFAGRAFYAPHATAPFAYGLTPLEDQQLAGLLMWAPGALPYGLAALALTVRRLDLGRDEGAAPWRG